MVCAERWQIRIYEPAVLIVGTRGRNLGGMQSLLPGSVSKYCLQQSPIPVIVVRPSTKREKKKKKRLADPSRRSYNQILQLSERRGSHIFDPSSSADSNIARLPDEEAAVAKALGLPASYTNSRSSLSTSDRSSVDDLASPNSAMRKSPSGDSLNEAETEKFRDARGTRENESDSVEPSNAPTPQAGAMSPTQPADDSGQETADKPANIQVVITEELAKDGSETKK